MFDLSIYSVVLLAHVAAATLLIGGSMFMPLIHRGMLEADSLGALRLWLGLGRRASSANPAIALVLLATGVYLGSMGWWTQAWFHVAAVAWLVNTLLAAMVVKPAASALGAAVGPREGAIDATADARRRSPGWALAHEIMRGSDMAMLYVMFVKPGLIESCVVTGVAIAAFLVSRSVVMRPQPDRLSRGAHHASDLPEQEQKAVPV